MNRLKSSLLILLLLTGPLLGADAPPSLPPTTLDPLAEVLPVLQAKYPDFASLAYKPGEHLSDLIARSGGKISLEPATSNGPAPILTATLPDGILYWRLASFTLAPGKSWPDLSALLQPASGTAPGIILDLRSNTAPDDYEGAGRLRGFFGSSYPEISTQSDGAPDTKPITPWFRSPVVVLTDSRTTGAAEALAGFLQADGALVVGSATAGKVALFQEYKLSSGQVLRYAVTANGDDPAAAFKFRSEIPAWGHPVIPDISLAIDDHSEKAALMLIRDDHISDVIQEADERHRMSEAALVQGQDPEEDDYLASLEKKNAHFLLSLPPVHDAALITAIDSLKAIRVSQETFVPPATAATAPASASIQ